MTARTVAPEYSLVMANLAGQSDAEKFVVDLSAKMPVGDDLYRAIIFHTSAVSDESAEWLRGFCSKIEKRLMERVQ